MSRLRAARRDDLLDLLRGAGLWILLIDHVQPDVLSNLTPAQLGFSDFAEIFIFLSGFINAAMYRRAFDTGGMRKAAGKLLARMLRLYRAHVASMLACLAILGLCATHGVRLGEPALYLWMDQPGKYLARLLTLMYAPHLFSLLPLYIVIAPFMLLAVLGLRRRPAWTLLLSAAIWGVAQTRRLDFAVARRDEAWYFHPLAWQFLFVLGEAAQMYWPRVWEFSKRPLAVRAALLVVAGAMALKVLMMIQPVHVRAVHLAPALGVLTAHDAGKGHLAIFRLIHFFSLAVLVVAMPWNREALRKSRAGQAMIACGRRSLPVYCLSLALAIGADLTIQSCAGGWGVQVSSVVACLGITVAVAYALEAAALRCELRPRAGSTG